MAEDNERSAQEILNKQTVCSSACVIYYCVYFMAATAYFVIPQALIKHSVAKDCQVMFI